MIGIERSLVILSLLCMQCLSLSGQTTLILENLPVNTPAGDGIYMSGNFENWSGGQEAFRLKPFGEAYLIDLPAIEQDIAFKFTRGSWETVEVRADGASIANRSLSLTKKIDTVRLNIEAWEDMTVKKSTASKNVHLLSDSFDMGTLHKQRRILIYLPAGYTESNKAYPVLYMQDGQNLFDNGTSYAGEWEVDETLDRMSGADALELIVVGIDHGGQERIDEYVPYKLKSYESQVHGHNYVQFITQELKPYVDENYRTLPGREHTGILGSSLGGILSFYAAMEFGETFGLAGIFSPSFELIDPKIPKEEIISPLKETRIYLMCGDLESEQMATEIKKMVNEMIELGFEPENIHAKVVKGGRHNEKLWKEEFGDAVRWLFKN